MEKSGDVASSYVEAPFGVFAPSGLQRFMTAVAKVPPLNRGHFRPWMARLILGAGRGRQDIRFRGGAFRVHSHDHPIEYGMMLYPAYNGAELEFLLAGLPAGGVAVDLGANIGMYAIPLALKAGPDGKVVAIDASEGFLAKLAFNASASGLANLAIVNVAVGDREGAVRLERIDKNPGTAEVREDAAGGIRMRPLAAILANLGHHRVDVMKVDIDGFEDRALTPFFDAAPDELLPRRVVIEHLMMAPGTDSCLAAMEARGYRLAGKTRSNSLYERDK